MGKTKITLEANKCNNCGNEWIPRSSKEAPLVCPRCKSPRWNLPRKKKKGGNQVI